MSENDDGDDGIDFTYREFRHRQAGYPGDHVEMDPGDMLVECCVCGYYGVIEGDGEAADAARNPPNTLACTVCGEQHQKEAQAEEIIHESMRRFNAGEPMDDIHVGGGEGLADLYEGVLGMFGFDEEANTHHCPECDDEKRFDVITMVPRPEFNVIAPVKGCPDCAYTFIPQTEVQ